MPDRTLTTVDLHPLEPRRFLDATLNNGILDIEGTRGNDVVRVRRQGQDIVVTINDDERETFARNRVNSIRFEGLRGGDTFRLDIDRPATLIGGAGNDTLVSAGANDNLAGGAGNDLLRGRNGNDSISGGAGRDNLLGADGNDSLIGGDARDQLDAGDGNDILDGSAGRDLLRGGAGSDSTTNVQELLEDAADDDFQPGSGGVVGGGPNGPGTPIGPGDPPIFGGPGGPVFGGGGGIFD